MNNQTQPTSTTPTGAASELTDVLAADSNRALELLGSIFYCGNFIAETRNEQELEMLMRKHGYFIENEAQFDAYCRQAHEAQRRVQRDSGGIIAGGSAETPGWD